MKVLVTGANGFIGNYVCEQLVKAGLTVMATGKGDCRLLLKSNPLFSYRSMDFTNPFEVDLVFEDFKPGCVVHAGANGRPDVCEQNQMQAYINNVEGTVTLLTNAAAHQSFFLFISTDFVFDGNAGPYAEDDPTNPVNYYGRTKLEAEEAVRDYEHDWAIVRTVLVFGKPQTGRENILTLVQKSLLAGQEIKIFDDQYRTPTYVEDLAAAIVSIIQKKATGTWHISGNEMVTPYQLSVMAARYLNLDESLICKIYSGDLAEAAKRPHRTGFIIEKAVKHLGYKPLTLEEGLKKTFSGVV
ncbi:MAG: SDR family oxidoreductase [Chitinophagaceae bacterium]|nr:SDR family oxidoreductase [Chitinophagaceae bacterium]